jgi:UMF1 family MFS transporter
MAGFFPLFFKSYWSAGVEPAHSTLLLGAAHSVAGLALALTAPWLGALADQGAQRKTFLLAFTVIGSMATMGLFWVKSGDWVSAAAVFVIASVGFHGAVIFSDSLLPSVSTAEDSHRVSGLGFALGYLGGGVLFLLNVGMYLKPESFGLADSTQAIRWSFLTVGIWWLVFSIPLFRFVPESNGVIAVDRIHRFRQAGREVLATLRGLRSDPALLLFLAAYVIYIDGVNTVIKMAVDYGLSMGFAAQDLILALLIVQFVGFPAALFFGWIGQRFSPFVGIWIGLAVYTVAVAWAGLMSSAAEFYAIAVLVGLVQGGVQSLSRSHFSTMVPPEKSGEFFGFFNMVGRFATLIGPLVVGALRVLSDNPRHSIWGLAMFFLIGGALLAASRRAGRHRSIQ